mgnify:FL=1|tara:strand:+ start:4001 stop:4108 length:108 start_codon:yes stop_codon:yes gene_type:complete
MSIGTTAPGSAQVVISANVIDGYARVGFDFTLVQG